MVCLQQLQPGSKQTKEERDYGSSVYIFQTKWTRQNVEQALLPVRHNVCVGGTADIIEF